MPVYSMTGYASGLSQPAGAEEPLARPQVVLGMEIRSVNSRFLDLGLRLPDELRAAEPALRECVGACLKRGKVELRVWLEGRQEQVLREPARADIEKLVLVQEQIRSCMGEASPLSVAEALQLLGRVSPATDNLLAAVLELAQRILADFALARSREGARLADMLLERVADLRRLASLAQPLLPLLVEQQRQRFLLRWQEALGLGHADATSTAAQDRALSEATAYAMRIDVAEELTRLQSHLDEIERLIHKGGEMGKRLDFFAQELHREANTLGSKSSSLELTRIAVDMKVLIEQMREQVQNLE